MSVATAQVVQVGGARVHLIRGLRQMYAGAHVSGPAFTCRCEPGDNLALHAALARAPAGAIVVCDAQGETGWGFFGELMATDARNRGLAGLVIDGSIRDVEDIERLGFPVFARGTAPAPATKLHTGSTGAPIRLAGEHVATGDQVIGDRDALAVVNESDWAAILEAAQQLGLRDAQVLARLRAGERLADVLGLDV